MITSPIHVTCYGRLLELLIDYFYRKTIPVLVLDIFRDTKMFIILLADMTMLPCEFCGEIVPGNELVLHQVILLFAPHTFPESGGGFKLIYLSFCLFVHVSIHCKNFNIGHITSSWPNCENIYIDIDGTSFTFNYMILVTRPFQWYHSVTISLDLLFTSRSNSLLWWGPQFFLMNLLGFRLYSKYMQHNGLNSTLCVCSNHILAIASICYLGLEWCFTHLSMKIGVSWLWTQVISKVKIASCMVKIHILAKKIILLTFYLDIVAYILWYLRLEDWLFLP